MLHDEEVEDAVGRILKRNGRNIQLYVTLSPDVTHGGRSIRVPLDRVTIADAAACHCATESYDISGRPLWPKWF